MSNRAWVTLATNDSYGLGALVLAHSLRRADSAFPAVVLITPSVTEAMRARLGEVFAEVIIVDVLDSGDAAHLALLQRPELGITFTKLHCWNLTQYEKCVFLDADTLIVQNCDELFDREELSAAPDVGWPDCFNSGVFVFKPSAETFSSLIKFAQERGSFDGGDQGLLNLYFSDWAHGDINKHLPFLYNVTSAAFYSYLPALKQYGQNLKIIHFIGATKPWLQHYNWRTRSVEAPEHQRDFLQLWWSLFVAEVHSKLDTSMVEMEESPIADPQDELEYAEDGLNTGHYEATLNPQSEFPWHHPDNQIQYAREDEPTIDMTEYHDPWNIYRGHIPPINDDKNQYDQQQMDHQEVRKYAWEYMPPTYDESHRNHIPSQLEIPFMDQSLQDTHIIHNEIYTSPQTETYHNTTERKQEYLPTDQNSQQNVHKNFCTEYVHHTDRHESSSKPHNSYHCEYHHSESQDKKSTQSTKDQSKFSSHTQHGDSKTDNLIVCSENTHHSDNVKFHETPKNVNYKRSQEPTQSYTPYVYSVHLDYNTKSHENDAPMVNGYASDDECDTFEDVLPRHPYDGFYLRHLNTIDSRGRKICSHEIPYLPSPTPTPPDSPEIFEDALDFPEDTNEVSWENHTGVAGHLARIGEDLQSGAIDELIRRQGWEAGNIDYMGADSFDNIWAKISQTLSQAPSSPPKQQSPPAPPAPSPIQGKDSRTVQEPLPVPVEATVKDLPKEDPLPVPVEKDTEKLASKEPLPVPPETDTKKVDTEKPLPEPVETDTKVLAQTEPLPVQAETDTKNLPSEEPVPEALQKDTNKVLPEESLPAPIESLPAPVDPKQLPLDEPVTLSVEAEAKEVPLPVKADKESPVEKPSEQTESETKTLPTETLPAATQADTKELPSEVIPEPIKADIKEPPSEVPPQPIKAEDKTLSSEVPASPIKPDTEVQLPEIPSPQAAEPDNKEEKPIPEPIKPAASPSEDKTEIDSDVPVSALEALKLDEKKPGVSDSPPLATTPSKEEATVVPAAKLEERRKPSGKLQLHPPATADPLPTPDSELEDAATLAQSIIASELRTPTVTSPSPTTEPPPGIMTAQPSKLGVKEPEVPTPPVGAVSLTQIGIKPKAKPTIAAQIESSVSAKTESTPQTPVSTPLTPSEIEAPKKKLVKKVTKKEKEGASSGEAPVPPPRKKEKKPKDK